MYFKKLYNGIGNAALCNGSTADSDSVCLGSNPSAAAKFEVNLPFACMLLGLCALFI